jgi:hypothetical protein
VIVLSSSDRDAALREIVLPLEATVSDLCRQTDFGKYRFSQGERRVLENAHARLGDCPLELQPVVLHPLVLQSGIGGATPAQRFNSEPSPSSPVGRRGSHASPRPCVSQAGGGSILAPLTVPVPDSSLSSNPAFTDLHSSGSPHLPVLDLPPPPLPPFFPPPVVVMRSTVVCPAPLAVPPQPEPELEAAPPQNEITITLILPPTDEVHTVTLPGIATVRDVLSKAHDLDARLDPESHSVYTGDDERLDPSTLLGSHGQFDLWVRPLTSGLFSASSASHEPELAPEPELPGSVASTGTAPSLAPAEATSPPPNCALASPGLPPGNRQPTRPTGSGDPASPSSLPVPALIPAPTPARFAAPIPPFPPPSVPLRPINYSSLLRELHLRTHADLRSCRRCLNYHSYNVDEAAAALSGRP